MATTLPVFEATNLTGGLLTFALTPWASIPPSSFVVGRRYLVLYHCEVQGSAASGGKIWADYNGSTTGIDSSICNVKRNNAVQYTSVNFMERLTVPAGGGDGLALRAQLMTGGSYPGAAIRNVRLLAIDLDVNNTDFPQQSGNGWLLQHSNNAITTLTGAWQYFLPVTFTPDGVSDYLILACGSGYNSTGWVYLGIGIDGVVATMTYVSGTSSSLYLAAFVSHIMKKPPAAPTAISIAGARSDASAWIDEPRFIILRLNTFTKYAASLVTNPTVISGTAWQSAQTITPVPAPVAGEQFLVLSGIRGYNWVSNDAILGMRVLRSGNQIAASKSSDLAQSAGDFLGPAFSLLSTAAGGDTYEQQFQKENYADRPVSIYYSSLVALKTEVGYTAPTTSQLAMWSIQPSTNPIINFPQSPAWTLYLTSPGYKFQTNHTYLVMLTFTHIAPGVTSTYSRVQLRFNTAPICTAQFSTSSNRPRHAFMMAKFAGTNGGDGLQLYGQNHAISSTGTGMADVRMVVLDLSSDPVNFPEGDDGWKYTENLTLATNTSSWLTHGTLSFTPDGSSDYLVIAELVLYDPYQRIGSSEVQLLKNSVAVEPASRYRAENTLYMQTPMQIVVPLVAPPASPITLDLQARKVDANSYDQITASRIFVVKLSRFKHWKAEFTTGPLTNNLVNPNWFNLESGAPTILPEVGSQILLLARALATGGTGTVFNNSRIRETAAGADAYLTTQGSGGGDAGTNSFSYMFAVLDTTSAAATAYTFDNQNVAGYGTSQPFSRITLLLLGGEFGGASYDDVDALSTFGLLGTAGAQRLLGAGALSGLLVSSTPTGVERSTNTAVSAAITWGGNAYVSDAPQAVNRTPAARALTGTLESFRFSARAHLGEIDRSLVRAYYGTGRCHYDGGTRPEDYSDVQFVLQEYGGTTPDLGAEREIDIDGALVLSKMELPLHPQESVYFFGGLEAPADPSAPLMLEVAMKLNTAEVYPGPDGFTGVAFGLMAGDKGVSVKFYQGGTYLSGQGIIVQSAGRLVTAPPNLSYIRDFAWGNRYLTLKLLWDPTRDLVKLFIGSGEDDVEDRIMVTGLVNDFPDLPAEERRINAPWAFFGHVEGFNTRSISRWKFAAFYNHTIRAVSNGIFAGGVSGFLRSDNLVEYLPAATPERSERPWKPLPADFPGGVEGAHHLEVDQLVLDRTKVGKSVGFYRTELALPGITVFDFVASVQVFEQAAGMESSGVEFYIDDGARCARLGFLRTSDGTQYVGLLSDAFYPHQLNAYAAVVQSFEVSVFYRLVFDSAGTVDLYRLVIGEGLTPEYVLSLPYSTLPPTMLPGPGLGFLHNASVGSALARLRLSSLRYSCNTTMIRATEDPLPVDWYQEGVGSVVVPTDREYIELIDTTEADSVRLRKDFSAGLQPDSGLVLEFRGRVESYEIDGAASPIRSLTGMMVSVVNDTDEMRLCFAEAGPPYNKIVFLALSSDDEATLQAIRSGGDSVQGSFVSVDWSTFHLYRMVKTIDGKTQLFIDDSTRPVINFDTARCTFAPSSGGTPRVVFGHKASDGIKTVSRWSHVVLSISRGFDFSLFPLLSEEELRERYEHSVNVLLELGDTT